MNIEYNYQGINFEWDEEKSVANTKKHRVLFETACETFFDPFLQSKDADLIDDELREIIIGATESLQMLYVAYTMRNDII